MGLRINFFGGPGVGKSTLAAQLFGYLKVKGFNVELAQEFVKTWAYQRRELKSFDSVYTFASQLHTEDVFLQSGVNMIVTDSPLLLQVMYAIEQGRPAAVELQRIAEQFERAHESVNFLVDRQVGYKPQGRYESAEDAAAMHSAIVAHLMNWKIPYTLVQPGDLTHVVREVLYRGLGMVLGMDAEAVEPKIEPAKIGRSDEEVVLQALYDLHYDYGFATYFDAHQIYLQANDLSGTVVSQTLFHLLETSRIVSGGMSSKGTVFAMSSEEQQNWREEPDDA